MRPRADIRHRRLDAVIDTVAVAVLPLVLFPVNELLGFVHFRAPVELENATFVPYCGRRESGVGGRRKTMTLNLGISAPRLPTPDPRFLTTSSNSPHPR